MEEERERAKRLRAKAQEADGKVKALEAELKEIGQAAFRD